MGLCLALLPYVTYITPECRLNIYYCGLTNMIFLVPSERELYVSKVEHQYGG